MSKAVLEKINKEKLKECMKNSGFTYKKLAECTGYTREHILYSVKHGMSLDLIYHICTVLDVPMWYILYGEDAVHPFTKAKMLRAYPKEGSSTPTFAADHKYYVEQKTWSYFKGDFAGPDSEDVSINDLVRALGIAPDHVTEFIKNYGPEFLSLIVEAFKKLNVSEKDPEYLTPCVTIPFKESHKREVNAILNKYLAATNSNFNDPGQ